MKNKTVFIVEDNVDIRDLIGYILTSDHYHVHLCANAAEFKSAIKRISPDLIILDIMLPDDNGLDMCKSLKSNPETAHIPVLLMSANNSKREMINEALAEDFISKPFDIDVFKNKVEKYL